MLTHISVKDFAIIKELSLELQPGLNIITGETGSGKSVVIEAISMALGNRADTAYVRSGADKAVITVAADTDDCSIADLYDELGIPDDNPMVLRREISAQSKSLCRVNGSIVPLSALSRLCRSMADIHGQYDQQNLLDKDNHLKILDLYGGERLTALKEDVRSLYKDYADYSGQLYQLKKQLAENEKQRDFLRYEADEIRNAKLCSGEDETLEEEIRIMENSEQLYNALSEAHAEIFGSDYSADYALGNALRKLESVGGISAEIDELTGRIADAYYELGDMNSQLRSLRDGISYSQAELDAKIGRIEQISALKRKYGKSIDELLEYADTLEKSLSDMDTADDRVRELEKKIKLAKDLYDTSAGSLSEMRRVTAARIESEVDKELADLNFSGARFRVHFEKTGSTAEGTDSAEFLISANVGEEPKPLVKVASGGELSRIMLALKKITGDLDGIPTMIFDEIDTGISGATAAVVGKKLEEIAQKRQVICITHLPQIACKGNSHFKIGKVSDEISTHTTVVPLSREERIEEIARLLSGTEITDTARMQAKELLGIHE